jgi:fucose permease
MMQWLKYKPEEVANLVGNTLLVMVAVFIGVPVILIASLLLWGVFFSSMWETVL